MVSKLFSFHRDSITPPWWIAKIFKIPVFRIALGNDFVSRVFIAVHNFFTRQCSKEGRGIRSFDPVRAQQSLDRFVALGAKVDFVTPRDGKGKVQMMTFQAHDLKQTIIQAGGSWERQDNKFVILPPTLSTEAWTTLKEKLSHFHWPETQNGGFITCDCADTIPPDAAPRCFLYVHSTSTSFISEWKRTGFYLGAQQDVCLFDNGNTWKNEDRTPSERKFYLEIEAVHDKIENQYSPDHLWVGGSCGGAPLAAYLKQKHHGTGINFFVEQSFPNLNDFVKPISPFFAPFVKGSLNSDDLPAYMQDPPPSCQFNADKLLESVSPLIEGGKSILVQVRDDEHISEDAYNRYLGLVSKTSKSAAHILFSSNTGWRHADNFFNYEDPRRKFLTAVFSS